MLNNGKIEIITGCMYSGKSEELIRRLRRSQIADQSVKAFKPSLDDRYSTHAVVSHSNIEFACIPIKDPEQIMDHAQYVSVIGIDEAQFFDSSIIDISSKLADQGCRVIIAGLDLDAFENPFGPIPNLLAYADTVDKLSAVCTICKRNASRTFRTTKTTGQIEIGADQYQALCRSCYRRKIHE